LNGEDLRKLPLLKRRAALMRILPKTKHNRIRFTDYVIDEGLALFAELEQRNLEGIVAKKIDSQYSGGRICD
jgi:ATP-dependent DNA ligase